MGYKFLVGIFSFYRTAIIFFMSVIFFLPLAHLIHTKKRKLGYETYTPSHPHSRAALISGVTICSLCPFIPVSIIQKKVCIFNAGCKLLLRNNMRQIRQIIRPGRSLAAFHNVAKVPVGSTGERRQHKFVAGELFHHKYPTLIATAFNFQQLLAGFF